MKSHRKRNVYLAVFRLFLFNVEAYVLLMSLNGIIIPIHAGYTPGVVTCKTVRTVVVGCEIAYYGYNINKYLILVILSGCGLAF